MSYDFIFQQALRLHQDGRFGEAEQLYRQILETAPDNPDVLNLLGLIAQVKGLHAEASELFYKAVKQAPEHAPFYFNLAVSLDNLNKPGEAAEAYQRVLKLQPENKEALYGLGNIEKSRGNQQAAENYYRRALMIDNGYVEPQAELALMENNPLAALNKLRNNYPDHPLPLYCLSSLSFAAGDYRQALKYAEETLNKAPNNPEALLQLAQSYLMLQEDEKASRYFGEVLDIDNRSIPALVNLGSIESRHGNFAAAEKHFKTALNIEPQNLEALVNYADMLYRAGRTQESVEIYHQAVIINPDRPEISNNLGIILKDLQDYEEALGLFLNAFLKSPETEDFSVNICETLILLYRQNSEQAIKIAEKWLKTAPDNVFARHINNAFKNKTDENPADYSRKLFDHFAENYEQILQNINYSVPQKIKDIIGTPAGTIVDLGCGTGLAAAAIKSSENHFIGVDISENMLNEARSKHLYDELIKDDILHFAEHALPSYHPDLILAADVFCYLGCLAEILRLCAPGKLVFSVEKSNIPGFHITPSGRYQHHPDYVKELLTKSGYSQYKEYPLILRQENGRDVEGLIFVAE